MHFITHTEFLRKRVTVGFIHEEHFAEQHKVLKREAKDTVDVINKQEQRKNPQQKSKV